MKTLLKKLNKINIKIDLVDEKLDIQAPKGVMTEDLLNEIKLYKNDLIAFINLHKTKKEKHLIIPRVPVQTNYVLSSSQRRLWLLSQFEGGNAAYNMPSVFELKGNVVVAALQNAFQCLIERHESLRTLFKEDETGQVRQFILNPEDSKFQLQFEDISKEENTVEIIKEMIQKETIYSFDLSTDSLLRAKLVKTSQDTHMFVCVMHHIISDGQSAEVMNNELFALYDSFVKGNENPLPALPLQYKDYATWQQDLLKNENLESHKSYWLQQFEGELPILDLPTYQTRPAIKTYDGKSVNKVFSENLFKDFSDLCQSEGSTLFMGLLAVVKVLLYRYTNQTDIIIGSPIAGRDHTDLQNQIGFYVNTLALRTQFDGIDSFKEILANVKEVTLGAYEHQVYPFDELVIKLPIKRDMSRNPLFDVMVTLQNRSNLKSNAQKIETIEVKEFLLEEEVIGKFDMDFSFGETEKGLELTLTYNTGIYTEEFTKRILNHLETLLFSIVTKSDVALNALNYLTEVEKNQILIEFNNTKVDYPKDKTIIDLFEEQVARTPNNVAVVFEEVEFSYKEVNEQANRLGSYLRNNYNIQPDDLIGIKLDRSATLIISILGVLKSGAAYVPIDSTYPQDRIDYIIRDSNCKLVIDEDKFEHFNKGKYLTSNLEKINLPTNLAYIIYTSGTTGNPKGVMVEHRSLNNLCNWHSNEFDVNEFSRGVLFSGVGFDASVWEIFPYLLKGSSLYPIKDDNIRFDSKKLIDFYKTNKISHSYLPSAICNYLINANVALEQVKFLVGGETLKIDKSSNLEIYNNYGPTENTVVSTFYRKEANETGVIPIGIPISNIQIYILDQQLKPVPIGVSGRIYIAGAGIARGYLNMPELTSEKFIPNPFNKGERMYDSGDLGCWYSDGNIEFLGRNDQQVKIRGFRIELEEIEKTFLEYSEDLKQAVVEVQEVNNEKSLVAYFVSSIEIDKTKIRNFLEEKLPYYMIPSFFVALENLPLTPNGKIDRKALPIITNNNIIRKEYIAPRTQIEKQLSEIWQEVLGVDVVGINDNFFELGGNSLLLMKIYEKFKSNFKSKINLTKFYTSTTIKSQAKMVSLDLIQVPKSEKISEIKLPFRLNNYWEREKNRLGAQNVSFGILTSSKIDFKKMNNAFHIVCNKHTILKSNIFEKNGEGFLKKSSTSNDLIFEKGLSQAFIQKKCSEIHKKKFDFNIEAFIRGYMFEVETGQIILFFSVSHLIFDGVSSIIFWKDLFEAYSSQEEITPLDNQFIESAWDREYSTLTENFESKYWKAFFKKNIKAIHIHQNTKVVKEEKSLELSFSFSTEMGSKIDFLCKEFKISTNAFFLSVIALLIKIKGNHNSFALCFDHHSRTEDTIEQIGLWVQNLFIEIDTENVSLNDFFSNTNKKVNDSMMYSNIDIPRIAMDSFNDNFEDKFKDLKKVRFNYYDESAMNYNLDNIEYEHINYGSSSFIPSYLHFFIQKNNRGIDIDLMGNNTFFDEQSIHELKDLFIKVCHSIILNQKNKKISNFINNDF